MKNSWMKRALAVLLCLAVFAVSELSGVTNVVRDLYAEEMDDGSEASDDADSRDKADNDGPSEAVEEVALEPSGETEQADEQPQGEPAAEASEGEEAGTEPGGEAVNPDGTEAAEGEAQDGELKEDGTPAEAGSETEAGTEGTETPAETEEGSPEQEEVFEGQLAEAKEGGSEITAAAVKPEEKPEPILKLVNDEDDNITVTVEAEEAGIIPDGASLSVTAIEKKEVTDDMEDEEKAKTEEINAQYDLTAEKLQEASEQREDDIVGFLAYDICLTDQDGNRTSPGGEVKVTLAYKEAAIPEELKNTETKDADVTVMHLEEDEDGEVKKAVDLADKVEDIKTTGSQEVEETEFVTDSSDIYAIAWTGEVGVYTYENDEVVITVSEETEGAIPAGSRLSVKPIVASEETKEQYQEVAQKLQEKAEDENYEIAGFLAYDITLIDKDGSKIEPNGGVKVTMDYKQAVIPEEVDSAAYTLADDSETSKEKEEDASTPVQELDLTVMHLEENDQGQVTKVVDMGAEGKVTELNSTKDQKVTSTEFVTESFSAFTIVWVSGTNTSTVQIQICDFDGNEITLSDDCVKLLSLQLDSTQNVFNISGIKKDGTEIEKAYYQLTDVDGTKYTFAEAGIFNIIVKTIKYENNQIYLIDGAGGEVPYNSSYMPAVRFHYDVALPEIDTIDNNKYGITMKMINYEGDTPQYNLLGLKKNWWIDEDGGGKSRGDLTQGAVDKRLKGGYPVASGINGSQKGASLAPLFGGGGSGVTTREANYLFSKDIYEATGYFQYSSFDNYAYLDENGDFTVYNVIGTPKNDSRDVYQRGNFLPYNKIREGKFSTNKNLYDPNGNLLTPGTGRYGEKLYLPIDAPNGIDYAFGMYIEATFSQPKNGQVVNNKGVMSNMTYNFNGDDDLWVFVDDTLVLDIGGSHDARSGWIDFASGTVHIEEKDIQDTNIRKLFFESGYYPDGSEWTEEDDPKADIYFKGNTFVDYSTHTVKMFYMEHGGEASNLYVSMNLPTIPKGTIEVEKQLGNTDKEKYKDAEFAFQLFVQDIDKPGDDKNKETYKDEYVTLTGAVDKATGDPIEFFKTETINGKEYENVFYLKPGQVAQFKNLQSDRKYYVKELDVKSSLYDKVMITGSTIENHDNEGGTTSSKDIVSKEKTVGERPRVVYINECSAQNSRKLWITKQMPSGQSSEDAFTFKVTLGEKPFDGQYTLIKSDGTRQENLQASAQGEISGVAVGDTVEIDQIMSGTIFKVEEINLTDEYRLEGIIGESGSYTPVSNTDPDSKALNGEILLGQHAEVTVTNALKNAQTSGLKITKMLKEGSSATNASFDFKVYQMVNGSFALYQGNYSVGNETKSTTDGKISIKADETAVIEMTAGTQFKVEETLSKGYVTPKITVTESTVTAVEINGETVEGTVVEGEYADITVTNIPKPSQEWKFVKASSSDHNLTLGGAEFTLTTTVTDKEGKTKDITYTGVSSSDNDSKGVITWKNNNNNQDVTIADMGDGSYTLTESKAPAGYVKDASGWKFTITDGILEMDEKQNGEKYIANSEDSEEILIYILNDPLYELPSTGGIGIHWYTIGGTLLMIAGMLILYRNKKRYARRC